MNLIIAVTPTHKRPQRMRYLRRCAEVFSKVPRLMWIVVEDGGSADPEVAQWLQSTNIAHHYFHVGPTGWWGNEQRNQALRYIRSNKLEGIVYLADDDNLYEAPLFDEIRKTCRVSVFPVGHLGPNGIERPIVRKGEVVGWDADWAERPYPVDMAGFAFHSTVLDSLGKNPWNCAEKLSEGERGGESEFLERVLGGKRWDALEPLCDSATRCWVWHNQPLEQPLWWAKTIYKILRWAERKVEGGTLDWFARRLTRNLVLCRVPTAKGIGAICEMIPRQIRILRLRAETRRALKRLGPPAPDPMIGKCLYASAVGAYGKPLLERVIKKFGTQNFDYLIFCWDQTRFDEPIFSSCRVIYESGKKWKFMRKYLTPECCRGYDSIFVWDDDLAVDGFDPASFLRIMKRNRLELAQPALTPDSACTHGLVYQRKGVGRYTDFVEIMAQVFTRDAWTRYWNILDENAEWGWGTDLLARDLCHYQFMGIVDAETIKHTRPLRVNAAAVAEGRAFEKMHHEARKAAMISYCPFGSD